MRYKICKRCKRNKRLTQFTINKQKKDGYNIYCKECCKNQGRNWRNKNTQYMKEYKKTYREFNKKEIKDYTLRYRYGISLEDRNKMLSMQDNKCKICQKMESHQGFVVDHCHKSKKIRGLLCGRCNRTLGMVKDDINLLGSMIEYLK